MCNLQTKLIEHQIERANPINKFRYFFNFTIHIAHKFEAQLHKTHLKQQNQTRPIFPFNKQSLRESSIRQR